MLDTACVSILASAGDCQIQASSPSWWAVLLWYPMLVLVPVLIGILSLPQYRYALLRACCVLVDPLPFSGRWAEAMWFFKHLPDGTPDRARDHVAAVAERWGEIIRGEVAPPWSWGFRRRAPSLFRHYRDRRDPVFPSELALGRLVARRRQGISSGMVCVDRQAFAGQAPRSPQTIPADMP